MYDEKIKDKKMLLEVIEALDKLNKNYVVTKSKEITYLPSPVGTEEKYEINIWYVREV